jgi:hypothetical protein
LTFAEQKLKPPGKRRRVGDRRSQPTVIEDVPKCDFAARAIAVRVHVSRNRDAHPGFEQIRDGLSGVRSFGRNWRVTEITVGGGRRSHRAKIHTYAPKANEPEAFGNLWTR